MKVPEFWQAVYIASIGSHQESANRHTITNKMDEAKILADQAVRDYKNSEFYDKTEGKTEDEQIRENIKLQDDIEEELEKIEAKERAEAYEWRQERVKRLFNIVFFWRKKA